MNIEQKVDYECYYCGNSSSIWIPIGKAVHKTKCPICNVRILVDNIIVTELI